jgi:transposase InsO family protein
MHGNARLTPAGRKTLVERIDAGRPICHVAAEMGISRATGSKWWNRWLEHGDAGLVDRSSRPDRSPNRTRARVERRVCQMRVSRKIGPARISMITGVPASTVWRILKRNDLNRLAWLDRPTGRRIRRYERSTPGELVHLDVKKVGKIPPGGGWRVRGRGYGGEGAVRRRVGYTCLHAAVDDRTRLAYVEAHDNERAVTAVAFVERARAWFATMGITVEAVMTDNGSCYRSGLFADHLDRAGIAHLRIKPRQPQVNGKVERFNRTLADEFLYARVFRSEPERRRRLDTWIHTYNHHRHHTAIGGPPITRVNNLPAHYT